MIMESNLRKLVNQLMKKQEVKVDELIRNDCDVGIEGKKLSFLKDCERELDYFEDISKFYGG